MVRCSNLLFSALNIIFLISGLIFIVSAFLYFPAHGHGRSDTVCHRALHTPILLTGTALTIMSLVGLIGSCCRSKFLLLVYSFVMFVVIVGLVGFTSFALLITNKGAGQKVSDLGFREYKLGDYSTWLQKHFVNERNWGAIRSCLIDAQVCKSLGDNTPVDLNVSDFYKKHLTSIQSGCCTPPVDCGFRFKNATVWEVPASGPADPSDRDCALWSNNQRRLCYDCDACKAGVVQNIKSQWRYLAIFNAIFILLAIFTYSIGCCARRSIDEYNRLPY